MNIEIESPKGNIYNSLIDIYLPVVNKIDIYIKHMQGISLHLSSTSVTVGASPYNLWIPLS